jgi:hypothetical protein
MGCQTCGKDWTGFKRCHCGACHLNFTSLSAFDKHRKDFKCLDPAKRGLVERDGYWGAPGTWKPSDSGQTSPNNPVTPKAA